MKIILKRRQILLLIATTTILLLTILAAGLSDLQFAPGQAQRFGNNESSPQQILVETANSFSAMPFWQQAALAATLFFLIVLSIILMPPDVRKRFIFSLLRMVLFISAIFYFLNNDQFNIELPSIDPKPFITTTSENNEAIIVETQVFEPEEIDPIWGYLVTFVILGIFGAAIWYIWWIAQKSSVAPLKEFSRIARKSLDDLNDGAEWENVIVRSYMEMGEVVSERRGIEREKEMTPHEFALRLVEAGLPPAPVERLTRLFEFVRYSPHQAGEEQMAEAIASLNEIAAIFGEK